MADQLPTQIAPGNRLLTAAEFQGLAEVPPEIEWFNNISNPGTNASTRSPSAISCGSPASVDNPAHADRLAELGIAPIVTVLAPAAHSPVDTRTVPLNTGDAAARCRSSVSMARSTLSAMSAADRAACETSPSGSGSLLTHRWRELDSNFQFRTE
jgi:hypothetical protein